MLVVDSSALVELLLDRPPADSVEQSIAAHGGELRVPHLLDLEVVSALGRALAAGEASRDRAEKALADLRTMPVERSPHEPFVPRVWALRDNFTAHDAVYVALAEHVDAPLLTTDARLARAIEAHTGVDVLLAT